MLNAGRHRFKSTCHAGRSGTHCGTDGQATGHHVRTARSSRHKTTCDGFRKGLKVYQKIAAQQLVTTLDPEMLTVAQHIERRPTAVMAEAGPRPLGAD